MHNVVAIVLTVDFFQSSPDVIQSKANPAPSQPMTSNPPNLSQDSGDDLEIIQINPAPAKSQPNLQIQVYSNMIKNEEMISTLFSFEGSKTSVSAGRWSE